MIRRLAFIALLIVPGAAQAQSYQCRAPASLPVARPLKPEGPAQRPPITGYPSR